ncbi:MAG TPA: hypothetical protein VMD47_06935 [Candidatus Acidoferrales bacterium]|nr:hypothetical protein [Candidatus Acidoferrales bacterium]
MNLAAISVSSLERAPAAWSYAAPSYKFADYDHTIANTENLTEASRPTFQALQSAAALPASVNPGYVLPSNTSDFLRLFSVVQSTAVERIYPAPIFSFLA